MTVARPLSAGRIVISLCSFKEWRACLCFFDRLSFGGDAFSSTRLVLALMLSASANGRLFTTVSTLATMSFVGIFFGVTEQFKPFSRRSFPWGDNVLVERLTTHLDLSIFWTFYNMISTESRNIIHIINIGVWNLPHILAFWLEIFFLFWKHLLPQPRSCLMTTPLYDDNLLSGI